MKWIPLIFGVVVMTISIIRYILISVKCNRRLEQANRRLREEVNWVYKEEEKSVEMTKGGVEIKQNSDR